MSAAYQRGANIASRLASFGLSSCLRSQGLPCASTSGSAYQILPCGDDHSRHFDTACSSRSEACSSFGSRAFHTSRAAHADSSDYYGVLGVSKSATESELKKAYYKLAKQYHPDANKGDATAATKFQEASKAYETLKDPQKRALYDQVGAEGMENGEGFGPFGGAGQGTMNPEELFKMFFGGGGQNMGGFYEDPVTAGKVGHDLQAELQVSFEEAARGGKQTIDLRQYGGEVEVNIPAGMFAGQVMTVKGKGAPARRKDGQRGNLLINLRVEPHPIFKRHGFDVHIDRTLDFVDAALGTTMRVHTIDGPVDVTIRPGAQHNDTLRIGGKGISKELQGLAGRRGDQIVHLRITFPRSLSKRQKELLEEFRREDQAGNQKQKAHA